MNIYTIYPSKGQIWYYCWYIILKFFRFKKGIQLLDRGIILHLFEPFYKICYHKVHAKVLKIVNYFADFVFQFKSIIRSFLCYEIRLVNITIDLVFQTHHTPYHLIFSHILHKILLFVIDFWILLYGFRGIKYFLREILSHRLKITSDPLHVGGQIIQTLLKFTFTLAFHFFL